MLLLDIAQANYNQQLKTYGLPDICFHQIRILECPVVGKFVHHPSESFFP